MTAASAPADAAEVLLLAADIIDRGGWSQGPFLAGRGHCAFTAVLAAAARLDFPEPDLRGTLRWLARCASAGAEGGHTLTTWNDVPGRTAGEVTGLLRACAGAEAARQVG